MRKLSNITFYFLFIMYILVYLAGITLVWRKFMLSEEIFIVISIGLYPLSLLYEQHYDRLLLRRERRDEKAGRFVTFLDGHDIQVLEGNYSTYSLCFLLLINGVVLLFRLLTPENISVNSSVISLILFIAAIVIMRKRDKETKDDHIQ